MNAVPCYARISSQSGSSEILGSLLACTARAVGKGKVSFSQVKSNGAYSSATLFSETRQHLIENSPSPLLLITAPPTPSLEMTFVRVS